MGDEPPGVPRYWPAPHPDRVGTRGGEVAEYAEQVIGQPFLPWQRQVADEILSVTRDGLWCHRTVLLLVPRQSGKSTLIRAVCEWFASGGAVVLSGSAKLQGVVHLMRPTQLRCRGQDGYRVSFALDQPEVAWPGWDEDSHRWIGQATNSMMGRGFTAEIVVLDEVQDVPVDALEAVTPAQTELPNPLTILTGTASRGSSELLDAQRMLARSGGPVALMEWSAPPGSDWRDERVWRAASPRWSAARLRHLRNEVRSKPEHVIRSEYLCQPVGPTAEPWINLGLWEGARRELDVPAVVQVAAVEQSRGGLGGAVAVAWPGSRGRVCVAGWLTRDLDEGWETAARADRVLCGVTLRNEPRARELGAKPFGRRETAVALPELRRLLESGLEWDGSDLDAQIRGADVREDSAGLLTVHSSAPSEVLRCAAWAVQAVRVRAEPVLV